MLIARKQKLLSFACIIFLIYSCNNSTETAPAQTSKNDSMSTATTTQRIRGSAGNLYVDDGGTGGTTVIFLHSFGGNTAQWNAQLSHLRNTRRALSFDMRGHGRSDAPANNDYSVESMANDLAAVVDSLKLDHFVLVGHSMGGSAAIAYAAKYPGKIAGLVVAGTPGKTPETISKPVIASLESDAYQKVMDDYMKKLLTNAQPSVNKEVMGEINKIPRDASVSLIKALFAYNPLPAFEAYNGPKLIVTTPAENQPDALHNAFPQTQHKVIQGTSHWMQMDKPEEFNAILDEFLKTVR